MFKRIRFGNTFSLEASMDDLEPIIFVQELGSLLVRVENPALIAEENDAGRHTINGVLQIVCS